MESRGRRVRVQAVRAAHRRQEIDAGRSIENRFESSERPGAAPLPALAFALPSRIGMKTTSLRQERRPVPDEVDLDLIHCTC